MKKTFLQFFIVGFLIIIISWFHYTTPTHIWQYHLIFMQSYFLPIILAAFWFGFRGGIISSLVVSMAYFPHVMLQWGGLVETNLMRFLQIGLFNIIGWITGFLVSRKEEESQRYLRTSEELEKALNEIKLQQEELSHLEEQLRQSDRLSVIGELTASLAHEIRNPLNSIMGTAEILRDEAELTPQQKEFLQIMLQEIKKVTSIIEQYLQYARKEKEEASPFNIKEVIRSVITLLQGQIKRKQIEFSWEDQTQDEIFIKGDRIGFQQIMMNLLLNAIQAVPIGGQIKISLLIESEKNVVIEIFDSGPGIPVEIQDKLFKAFFSTKKEGTGLGLAISQRIAEKNGWSISCVIPDAGGTVFRIYCPFEQLV